MKRKILLILGFLFCFQTVEIKADATEEAVAFVAAFALTVVSAVILKIILDKMSSKTINVENVGNVKERFSDVAGIPEAIAALKYVIEYIKHREQFSRLGAVLPKGILLYGPPGTGKTLLARAVAGEANCSFIGISCTELLNMFVGVTEANIRALFSKARAMARSSGKPCIIFLDEIDAIGRSRSDSGGLSFYSGAILNQLLVEMDGFNSKQDNIIIIGATNRIDFLDEALLRPGRFDQLIAVNKPDAQGRKEILEVHIKKIKHEKIDTQIVALNTPGFSGADLANLVNKAAIIASKKNSEVVTMAEFSEARDQILLGERNETKVLNKEDLEVTAYHEAGHALMILLAPQQNMQLHQITICPRGNSLGLTSSLPKREKFNSSKEEMLHYIRVALGGRAAEEMVFNLISTGAYSDFKQATEIARSMICDYGMTDAFGKVIYANRYSEAVESAIKEIVNEEYKIASELLQKNRDKLDKLARRLLQKDTLDASEVYELLEIEPPAL